MMVNRMERCFGFIEKKNIRKSGWRFRQYLIVSRKRYRMTGREFDRYDNLNNFKFDNMRRIINIRLNSTRQVKVVG